MLGCGVFGNIVMDIRDIASKNREGYYRIGVIFSILNSIETKIVTNITVFFTDWQGTHQLKGGILNRALFNEKIFTSLETKRQLFKSIIEGLDDIAKWKKVEFESGRWLTVCKSITKIQEIRNLLAHNMVMLSEDGLIAKVNISKKLFGPLIQKEINLDDIIENANCISQELDMLLPIFLQKAQEVLNAENSNPA